jgi:hypothetical protein
LAPTYPDEAMANLYDLAKSARDADPGDRISFRDPIAAYGVAAIPSMTEWLGDALLGGFAVRVLERIAEDPANRRAAIAALATPAANSMPEHVARDIAQALTRLGASPSRNSGSESRPRPRSERWPGGREVSPLDLRFHDAMLDIFTLAGEATRKVAADGSVVRGYWAQYFLRGVRNHGGPEYARQLLRAAGTSDGFQRLTDERRLDLTMEALVLRPEFASLFTDSERAIAASRLARAGYQPSRG